MHWISIILIGIAANLDNLGIGVSFGVRSTKIPFFSNLIISFMSMLATYFSLMMGSFISQFVSGTVANFVGGILIICLGVWTFWSSLNKVHIPEEIPDEHCVTQILRNPSSADIDRNLVISWKESITLGFALALNCITSGFGAGISGVPAFWTTISIGLFSIITIDIGVRAGYKIAQTWFGQYSTMIAGLLLIVIGCYEIIV